MGSNQVLAPGLTDQFAAGDLSLVAFNISKKELEFGDPAQLRPLAKIVQDPQMLLAAGMGFSEMKDALVKVAPASPLNRTTMYINGARDGYCSLCNVDSVSGPGLSSCDVDACAAPGSVAAQEGPVLNDYKEHYVIMADLDVTSRGDQGGLIEPEVQEAVASLLALEGDGLETLQVTVSDTTPDSLLKATFQDGLPDGHERRRLAFHRAMATELYDMTQRFKVMIVATSRDRSESVLERLQPSGNEAPSLQTGLTAFFSDPANTDVGSLQLLYDRMIYVPAYNTRGLLDNDMNLPGGQSTSLATFSVALQDAEQPAIPVTSAHYGADNNYVASLAHFPPGASVGLRLVKVGSGLGMAEASWPLGTINVDKQGVGKLAVQFQPLVHREGDYFLKATETKSGIYNFSPVFSVDKGARRRKMYGPEMFF
jgi:hypothetical protein